VQPTSSVTTIPLEDPIGHEANKWQGTRAEWQAYILTLVVWCAAHHKLHHGSEAPPHGVLHCAHQTDGDEDASTSPLHCTLTQHILLFTFVHSATPSRRTAVSLSATRTCGFVRAALTHGREVHPCSRFFILSAVRLPVSASSSCSCALVAATLGKASWSHARPANIAEVHSAIAASNPSLAFTVSYGGHLVDWTKLVHPTLTRYDQHCLYARVIKFSTACPPAIIHAATALTNLDEAYQHGRTSLLTLLATVVSGDSVQLAYLGHTRQTVHRRWCSEVYPGAHQHQRTLSFTCTICHR
jgi:hypothetical protein